jgi:hypothetical protein
MQREVAQRVPISCENISELLISNYWEMGTFLGWPSGELACGVVI